jgi:hypothetical protein
MGTDEKSTWWDHFMPKSPALRRARNANESSLPAFISGDGVRFVRSPSNFRQIYDVSEYRMQDIRKDDVVIDIGANVGAFCIRAARKSHQVMAFEPLTFDLLEQNIRLNDTPVRVFEAALGDGYPARVTWDTCQCLVRTMPLQEMITCAGGCDFLKCDCEGAEWMIRAGDLSDIRRIEMELHQPPIGPRPDSSLLEYIGDNYEFVIDRTPVYSPLGQMGILHAWRKE